MKKHTYTAAAAALIVLLAVACGKQLSESRTVRHTFVPLADSLLTDAKAVDEFIFKNEFQAYTDSVKALASQSFLAGADLLINKRQPEQAILPLRTSLRYRPEANGYMMLARACIATSDTTHYTLATGCLDMASHLNYEPGYMVDYERKIAEVRLDPMQYMADINPMSYFPAMKEILQRGFSDTAKLARDMGMGTDGFFYELYHALLPYALRDAASDSILFAGYESHFLRGEGAYYLNVDSLNKWPELPEMGFDYDKLVEEMGTTEFGRNVSQRFHFDRLLHQDSIYTLVLYRQSSPFYYEDGIMQTKVYAASYTPAGRRIDKQEAACLCSKTELREMIWEDGKLTVVSYATDWVPPSEEDANGEFVLSKKTENVRASYLVGADGKFIPTAQASR